MRYLLRGMEKEDIDAIIEGEEIVFGQSMGKDFLLSELEINPFSQYIVLEVDGKVSGYIGLWITDNVQVMNFYVLPEYQKMGFGTMIMEFVIKVCLASKVKALTLEVRESNIKAIKLYERFGLKKASIRKAYYNNGEDALLMERVFEVQK